MAHCSDTESEPGSSVSGWDTGDSLQMATELGHIGDGAAHMLTVPDALDRLAGLDICAVKQDERLHEEVQQVSSALLSFLDGAITAGQVNGQNPEKLQEALCMMLHATSMTLLLDYRFLFRDLAARSLEGSTSAIATATWLQHLDAPISDIRVRHSVEWWDEALVETLQCDPTAALSMLSRLLSSAMVQVKRSQPTTLDGPVLDMILKVCWSIKHVLQLVHVDVTTFSTLYGLMYTMFMALEDEETELAIKDLLIEGLSFSTNGLQQALDDVCDPQSDCARTLERSQLLNATLSSGEVVRMLDMRSIRQTLQILTLAWTAGRRPCALRGLVQQFLTIVVDWVDSEWLESEAWIVVRDAMIVALAAWKGYTNATASPVPAGTAGEKLVGELIEDADPLELPLAAALAQYFCETMKHPPYNALALSEAFNYFRDVALLILNHEYGGTDEPLSLLVAPAIFRALIANVQYAPPATRNYITSSPWTLCLVMHMKRLEDEGQSEEYYQILREQVYPLIKILGHIVGCVLQRLSASLMSCTCGSCSCPKQRLQARLRMCR
ncbi:hypothetical protein BD413DRAFT_465511 [Trametes elegans]|nr:hypothetical protein BD413DRAFT_465511 [Trametes elegans]